MSEEEKPKKDEEVEEKEDCEGDCENCSCCG